MDNWEFLYNEAKRKLVDFVNHKNIPLDKVCLSFSGGKDSTILLKMIEEIGWKNKIKVVFFNTLMEFDATVEFVNKKRQEGWVIDETKPKKNHIQIYKEYGYPFQSKYISEMIGRLQKHNFDFVKDTYKSFEELIIKYPNCKTALRWLTGKDMKSLFCPQWVKRQLPFLKIKIANKCCEFLKKKPVKDYEKEHKIILHIIGIRQAEGLSRKNAFRSCIWSDTSKNKHKFFPILFFSDKDVWECINKKNIELSKAYTLYGMERTGCVGCPFSLNYKKELEALKQYEPKRYTQTQIIYKDIYAMKDNKKLKKEDENET